MHRPHLKLLTLLVATLGLLALVPLSAAAVRHPAARHTTRHRTTKKHATRHRAPVVRTVKSPAEPGLTLGLSGAQAQLASGSASSIASWDGKAQATQAQIVRIGASWSSIAPGVRPAGFSASDPNSPGYNWSNLDAAVRDIANAGFDPLVEVQSAPTWAEGPGAPKGTPSGTWKPDAAAFGQFATALATRYDGSTAGLPKVTLWQAWNEPNLNSYLNPQWVGGAPASPGIYRSLENAFYTSLKAVSPANYVIAAGTAPYGDPNPGGARMQPVTFDQNLLCLTVSDQPTGSCPSPTYFDAIDNHPYVSGLCCLGPTWHAGLAQDTSIPDMYKITRLLNAARSAGTAAPAGPKGVWATELGWNTNPPNPDTRSASAPGQVATWATQALYILWSQGVNTVFWYSLADPASKPAAGWDSTYEEGLYFGDGSAKPAAAAFAFPFLTQRRTRSSVRAWGRAPKAGMLYVQKQVHGRWISLVKLNVSAGQVFEVPVTLAGSASVRALVGDQASPTWSQGA